MSIVRRPGQEQEHGTHDGRHDDENGHAQGVGVQVLGPDGGKSSAGQQARVPVGHRHRSKEIVQSTETCHVRGGRPSTSRYTWQRLLQLGRMGSFFVGSCSQHGLFRTDSITVAWGEFLLLLYFFFFSFSIILEIVLTTLYYYVFDDEYEFFFLSNLSGGRTAGLHLLYNI